MVKHFCDRCGKEIPDVHTLTDTEYIERATHPTIIASDMCDDCGKELEDWLRHPVRYQELYKKLHDPEEHKKLGEALKKSFDKGFGRKEDD